MFGCRKGGRVKGAGAFVLIAVAVIFFYLVSNYKPTSMSLFGADFAVSNYKDSAYSWLSVPWSYTSGYSVSYGGNFNGGSSAYYSGLSVTPQSDGSLKLSDSCSSYGCRSYFRKQFDLGQYSQLTLVVGAKAKASTTGFASASASYGLYVDGRAVSALSASTGCVGGGCAPNQDFEGGSSTVTLISTGNGWDVYVDSSKLFTTSNANPDVTFQFETAGSPPPAGGGSGSGEVEVTLQAVLKAKGEVCGVGQIKLVDGTCKSLIRTCIDNNQNNVCDPDEPIIYEDPATLAPVCSDRDGNGVCDNVQSLLCTDSNGNGICDSDELKWYATSCADSNGNGICDDMELGHALCQTTYVPVCDVSTNVTYPNSCFSAAAGVSTVSGACVIPQIIVETNCLNTQNPDPSTYSCDNVTKAWIKTEVLTQLEQTTVYREINNTRTVYVYSNITNSTAVQAILGSSGGSVSPVTWIIIGVAALGVVYLAFRSRNA